MATKLEPIAKNPEYARLVTEIDVYEERLAKAHARREAAIARQRGAKPKRSVTEMAASLVAGGVVAGTDPAKEIESAEREIFIMREGIRDLTGKLNRLVGDLSLAVCDRVQAEHTGHLRRALAAIREAQVAFADAAAIRAAVRGKGYTPLESRLPFAMPPAIAALGDGNDGRQLSWWLAAVRAQNVQL